MKKKSRNTKIIGIVLCMLLFTTILPVADATDILKVETTDLEINSTSDIPEYIFIRGKISDLNRDWDSISFKPDRVHYSFFFDNYFYHGWIELEERLVIQRPFIGIAANNFIIGFIIAGIS